MGFATNYSSLYKTIDGGATWNLLTEQTENFHFTDSNIGFSAKFPDGIFKTLDSGLSFETSNWLPESDYTLYRAIFTYNQNVVWSVGQRLTLCGCGAQTVFKHQLIDGVYQKESNIVNKNFYSIYFTDSGVGYIVGEYGIIYKNINGENYTILSTNDFDFKSKIKIYPNPTSDNFTITFEEKSSKPVAVEISDLSGKKVFNNVFNNEKEIQIDTKSFSKGVYFLTVAIEENKKTEKLIVN